MTPEQIKYLLEQSIKNFTDNEGNLFCVNVNERSMTHKFAEYLQIILKEQDLDLVVDCEYNRDGSDPKSIGVILESKTVYPDIIVHKRGKDGPNILVIEAKKDASKSSENKDKDIQKLRYIKSQFGYKYAIFLDFKTAGKDIEYEYV